MLLVRTPSKRVTPSCISGVKFSSRGALSTLPDNSLTQWRPLSPNITVLIKDSLMWLGDQNALQGIEQRMWGIESVTLTPLERTTQSGPAHSRWIIYYRNTAPLQPLEMQNSAHHRTALKRLLT